MLKDVEGKRPKLRFGLHFTDVSIDELQTYYDNAILANVGNIEGMLILKLLRGTTILLYEFAANQ